ncbi:RNA polymerase sigma factor [Amycolatopsis sp. cmx-11-32]|uniref:RNA polymerase sigma factor n=1 Tax=Amycolatopsis sp. cmx-11-32 TaxID=2785796 RepID=UPI0039E62A90
MNGEPTRVQEVDESRFVDLLHAQGPQLLRYILTRVGDTHAAQVIRQVVLGELLVYWRRRHGVPDDDAVRLLYGFARRKIGNWRREQTNAPVATDDEVLHRWLDTHATDTCALIDTRVDLVRALAQLDELQRQALMYVYVDQLSYDAAAALLRVSRDGLNNVLRAAKKAARKCPELTEYGTQKEASA